MARLQLTGDWQNHPRNDYEKEVFNGDIGRIRSLAYAVSVRKAQGGEFPAVVLVGTRRALHIGLSKPGAQSRFTGLTRRLRASE